VSTDCPEIQQISIEHGAEAPFLRPDDISGDLSTDLQCFRHYLAWLKYVKDPLPDVLVHLRPTYPERKLSVLNHCIASFLKVRTKYDSLRTVIPMDKSPFKMYTLEEETLKPLFESVGDIKEPYNQVRQVLPACYLHNGYVDILNRSTIEKENSMTGRTIYSYVMKKEEDLDIDTHDDMHRSLNSQKIEIT
jgi:CMP-N-acetylneuraminic acid synthetase